jgi:hypothetical protein
VLEVKTFRAPTQEARLADLAEALEFARVNLAAPDTGAGPDGAGPHGASPDGAGPHGASPDGATPGPAGPGHDHLAHGSVLPSRS